MAQFDPSHGAPAIPHPGSLNANPMSLAAGAATLELLTREEIARINELGEQLRSRLGAALDEAGLDARVTGCGSLFAIHPSDGTLRLRLFLGLYNEGVLIDPRGVGTISTALGPAEVDRFLESVTTVAGRIVGHTAARP
jgi:glutamate-1-semialdehyde 2,1-aminomutase